MINKNCLILLLLALLAFLLPLQTTAQEMLVGSYNIRYKNDDDSLKGERWAKRCQVICDQVNFMAPAVIGAQEVLHAQLDDMMTREGVMGNEYNKWDLGLSPEHNVKLAFTRMLAGPMDYTPGGFLNVSRKEHKPQQPALVDNGRCAELAKFVIYESPYTVVCDHPRHILGQPGADFLKSVPTTWDDTRFLQGSPDSYIAMARRDGDRWFIGVMNNSEPRTIVIDTSFLEEGGYSLTYWSDGKKASDVIKKTVKIKAGKTLKIKMATAGGYVAEIKP